MVDLFRYQSPGNPVLIGATPGAYFSYDGGMTNGAGTKMKVYNTLDISLDYADFTSSSPCQAAQSVQDAQGCPGQDHGLDITDDGGAEINILNAVGYQRNAQAGAPPVITSVLNGATGQSIMAASTYVAIYGSALSTTNPGRTWTAADFTAGANQTFNMPTSLDSTSVTVSGVPAYVEYVSPTQLNIIIPAIAAMGNGIPVVVSVNGVASAPFSVTLLNLAPSFFAWSPATADAWQISGRAARGELRERRKAAAVFHRVPNLHHTGGTRRDRSALRHGVWADHSPASFRHRDRQGLQPQAYTDGHTGRHRVSGQLRGSDPPGVAAISIRRDDSSERSEGDLALIVNVNGTLSVSGLITVNSNIPLLRPAEVGLRARRRYRNRPESADKLRSRVYEPACPTARVSVLGLRVPLLAVSAAGRVPRPPRTRSTAPRVS